jgi:tetratricopeptide (TPR) repeat protein
VILALFSLVAFAAPDAGVIVLSPSPGARVEVLPRRSAQYIEIGIYDNIEPVHEQLQGRSARYVEEIDVLSVGGGTWFVTLAVTSDDVVLRVDSSGADTFFVLERGAIAVNREFVAPTLGALVSNEIPRVPANERVSTLSLLSRDAAYATLASKDVIIARHRWAGAPPQSDRTDRDEIIYQRMNLSQQKGISRAYAQYEMGERHLSLGLPRDALAYLDAAAAMAPGVPEVHLARAEAAVKVGNYDVASTLCGLAYRSGAADTSVLLCIGAVALGNAGSSPTGIARAIVADSISPASQLLAGSLLLMDDRLQEATEVLTPIVGELNGEQQDTARLALGDALFGLGEMTRANEVWAGIQTEEPMLVAQLKLRFRIAGLVVSGTASWAEAIPELRSLSRRSDRIGAECHYLLAQIYKTYGDPEGEARHLRALRAGWPGVSDRAGIRVRQAELNLRRMSQLQRAGKAVELSAWYRRYWEAYGEPYVRDISVLESVARANEELGLSGEALRVAATVSRLQAQRDEETASSLLLLAELYVANGLFPEAQTSVKYGMALDGSADLAAKFHIVSGRAYEATGSDEEAARQYILSMTDMDVAVGASRRLGELRLRQGQYEESVEMLSAVLAQEPTDSVSALSLARALMQLDRSDEALELALAVQQREEPDTLAAATSLVQIARGSVGVTSTYKGGKEGVWSRLLSAEAGHSTVVDRVNQR